MNNDIDPVYDKLVNNVVSGLNIYTLHPLIDFNMLVDTDMGLIRYVVEEYPNEDIFDLDRVLNITFQQLVGKLYYRQYKNPLYFLMRDESKKDFIDQCYKELLEEKMEEILNRSTGTEMISVVQIFLEYAKTEIHPVLLYHNDIEKRILDDDSRLGPVDKISFNDLSPRQINFYTQYYFKYIEDCKPIIDKCQSKTFYFSSAGLNCNEDYTGLDIPDDIMKHLLGRFHDIDVLDLYQESIIGSFNDNYKKEN